LNRIALFQGASEQQYLAVIWNHASVEYQLEFHEIIPRASGRPQIRYLRNFVNGSVDLHPASGKAVFPNEPTIAVVYETTGGTGIENYRLHLIQMKRNTVDITPEWAGRIVDVVDIDGDGRYEVVGMDDWWRGDFGGTGWSGPFLPIVVDRADGEFRPVCRKFTAVYRKWIDNSMQYSMRESATASTRATDYADAVLAYAQIGAFADAHRALAEMTKVMEDRKHFPDWFDPQKKRQIFAAVLANAEKHPDAQCPASTGDAPNGPFGPKSRLGHIRFTAPQK
jgi:hypothetical protein